MVVLLIRTLEEIVKLPIPNIFSFRLNKVYDKFTGGLGTFAPFKFGFGMNASVNCELLSPYKFYSS